MSEYQPDLLGGKGRPGRRTPKIRRNARPRVAAQGHADTPGTGPEGETCGSCHWLTDYRFRKLYHKCGARPGDQWKGGRATDIGTLDAACSKWQPASNFVRGLAASIVGIDEADSIPAGAIKRFHSVSHGNGQSFESINGGPFVERISADMGGAQGGGKTERTNAQVRAACLDLIVIAGERGLTADECAARMVQDAISIRPRLTELFKAGAIEKTGARRATASGRTAAAWRAKGGK